MGQYVLVGIFCLLIWYSFYVSNSDQVKEFQEVNRYKKEEILFFNKKAGIKLYGTLTYPNKNEKYPAVILISGRGQQDRDASTGKHKTFFVLADYLTRSGIAVLRFDDRGVGKSEGEFNFLTTTKEDISDDALAAYYYLLTRSEIDAQKIGFIGHSEGGIIAAMAASKTANTAFIVLLATPGLNGGASLSLQIALVARSFGISETTITKYQEILNNTLRIVKNTKNKKRASKEIAEMYKLLSDNIGEHERNSMRDVGYDFPKDPIAYAEMVNSPGWNDFLMYEPITIIKKVKCPILVLNGEKDLQVPSEENLKVIRFALKEGKAKDYTVKALPNINHLFQSAITGSPIEYQQIEETISPIVLVIIKDWIVKHVQ